MLLVRSYGRRLCFSHPEGLSPPPHSFDDSFDGFSGALLPFRFQEELHTENRRLPKPKAYPSTDPSPHCAPRVALRQPSPMGHVIPYLRSPSTSVKVGRSSGLAAQHFCMSST